MELKISPVTLPGISAYMEKNLDNRKSIYKYAEQKALEEDDPIVGPSVGNFLYFISKLVKAKKVLELGSSIGYSTLWFADAVGKDGRVIYTDFEVRNLQVAKSLALKAGWTDRIQFELGDCFDFLKGTEEKYDIIFLDCNKTQYLDALETALPKLNNGGLLIADNSLWGGRVRWEIDDLETNVIKEFNKLVFQNPKLISTLIPLKDGLTISLKSDRGEI